MDTLSPAQLYLLKACLASSKDEREKAVRAWEEEVVMNDLDFSSSRLIPYFFYRNQQDGISSKHDKRIKVIYKHWWLRSQHIAHQLREVHAALSKEGVKAVIIKGASIKTHYERAELRPMADFDLLVPLHDLSQARQIVTSLGYRSADMPESFWETDRRVFLDFNHAISYTNQNNDTQLDLHWKVGSLCSARFTEDLWLNLDSYELVPGGKKPRLAYEVFMIIVHAVSSASRDNLNWIIDIALINSQNAPSFWQEARQLAILEKKADIFDYGCQLLLDLGVYALKPLKAVKKPRTTFDTSYENRKGMAIMMLSYYRIQNTMLLVNRLFARSGVITKVYHVVGIARRSLKTGP